jgi:hypothetical protein
MGDYLMTYYPEVHWGDGSDGDVTISVDTDLAGVVKQYNNLTINAGVKLYDSTGALRIYVRNKLTLNGNIDQSGLGGAGGAGSAGVFSQHYGGSYYASPGEIGLTKGGTGADGVYNSYSGGALDILHGGIIDDTADWTSWNAFILNLDYFNPTVTGINAVGGGGTGGGGGNTSLATPQSPGGDGGDGGAGGGFVFVAAKKIVGSGIISAAGLPGEDGMIRDSAAGGGGGGGGGGVALVYYKSSPDNTFTVTADGGSGGANGSTVATAGTNGIAVRRKWIGVA